MNEHEHATWSWRGPLANSYWSAVALVVFALVPYLVMSTALGPLEVSIQHDVGLSTQAMSLTSGMANAAYAFGTVLAVQLAQHLHGRRLLIGYALLFTLGSLMTVTALTPGFFIAGRILQGLCTSLMLIAAVPPLVIGWPPSMLPWTAAVMNMCIFGAVAVGPVVGGVQAGWGGWHLLFWVVAGLGALAFLFALLTFEDMPPQDTTAPWDFVAQLLAGLGCAAAFFGGSQLTSHAFMSTIVFVPLVGGVATIILLVCVQGALERPLMPIRSLKSTLPLAGIITALCAGAASVGLVVLTELAFADRVSPTHLGMLFWPEFGAALASALIFGLLVRTKWVPVIVVLGLVVLAGSAVVLSGVATGPESLVVIGSGMLGIGVGSSVSPGLFMAGFSQPVKSIQRIFAMIELLRGVAAFLVAPILVHLAQTTGGSPAVGIRTGTWICFGLAIGAAIAVVYLLVLGRFKLTAPDIGKWEAGDEPAVTSPPIAAGIRGEGALGVAV